MSRLSQHGGFDEDALKKAKEAMAEGLDFAEQQEPLARNQSGYPSLGNFTEQHFDFKQCKRSDGTVYGVPDASACVQKGSKEVSKSEGDGPLLSLRAQMAKSPEKFDNEVLSKLGGDALKKINSDLSKSGDPVDKKIAKLAKDRLSNLGKSESPYTALDEKTFQNKREAYTNHFKENGYSNPEERGALAAINKILYVKGGLSKKEAMANARLLEDKSKPYADLKRELVSRGKEARPGQMTEAQRKARPKASLTRNAPQSEVLSEYRNNLKNKNWTLKQQAYSKSVRESAQGDAIRELVRDGYDPRKLLSVPGFESLSKHINKYRYD